MNWHSLLLSTRLEQENDENEEESGRTHFHKDFDRISFSSSFRRLGKKTQVHPLVNNDHIHSRLTHSIEVSNVGRSLGIIIGEAFSDELPGNILPIHIGQILQAACLAHDIGNPPFGHAGEDAIKSWFQLPETAAILEGLNENQKDDFKYFEGNAQGFRILTQLEYNLYKGGMRLTYATLATMLKYPWTSREIKKIKKFSCFHSEKSIFEKIAERVGLIKKDKFFYCRHPLAFLADAADDICYRILDLEDAREMKIIQFKEILNVLKPLCESDKKYKEIVRSKSLSDRRKMSFIRAKSIGKAIDEVSKTFINNYDLIMQGKLDDNDDLISKCDKSIQEPLDNAKILAKEKIFNEPRKIELEIGCYTAIGTLLQAFCNAVREKVISGKCISYKSDRILSMMGSNAPQTGDDLYTSFLRVTDYISGMTDNYASHIAKQIGGMGK